MTKESTNNITNDDHRKTLLLKMHEFYSNEAKHQRTMMWDTVKWFTPVLTALYGAWFYLYKNFDYEWGVILAGGGIILSLICLNLLSTFYKSNLIYLSMFIKIEDELDCDKRLGEKTFFHNDNQITYERYREGRLKHSSALSFVNYNFNRGTMHYSMQYVFYLFILGFLSAFWLGLWNQIGSKNLDIWTNIISVVFGLLGAYLLAFSLRIKTQYSKDLVEMIRATDKELLILTEVSQRHKLFWWGFTFVTIAALIQLFLLLSKSLI